MTPASDHRRRIGILCATCCEAFGAEPTDGLLEAWWLSLRALPLAAVERAVEEALCSGRAFAPRPGEVRQMALGLDRLGDEAELAYVEARRAAQYGGLDQIEPSARAALEAIGGRLKLIDESACGWQRNPFDVAEQRRRFLAAYQQARREEAHRAAGLALPGADRRLAVGGGKPAGLAVDDGGDGRVRIGEIEG